MLIWAVSALLLSCWRADASTGKNCVSAMLVEDVDFAPTTNMLMFFFEVLQRVSTSNMFL